MNDSTPHSAIRVKLIPAVSRELAQANKYTPVTISRGTLSVRQVATRLSSGGGNLSTAQAAACLERAFEVILEAVKEGHRVTLGRLGYLGLRGSGVFNADAKPVDGKELIFALRFQPGAEMKSEMSAITGEVIETEHRAPVLRTLTDAETGAINQTLTPGTAAQLVGKNLRFNALNGDEGLYFIPQDAGGGEALKATKFLDVRETRVTFTVPALTAGMSYRVEVRKRFYNCKTLRVGMLDHVLTVN